MLNKFINIQITYKQEILYSLLMFSNTIDNETIINNIINYYNSCLNDEIKMIEYVTLRNQFIKGVFF